jgi:hypothetical protein
LRILIKGRLNDNAQWVCCSRCELSTSPFQDEADESSFVAAYLELKASHNMGTVTAVCSLENYLVLP